MNAPCGQPVRASIRVYVCDCMCVHVCSTLRMYEKQHMGMLGLTLPTP